MKNSMLKMLFLVTATIAFAGCSTEYNKDVATDKARNYVFEQIPRMSPQNASYIKYTYPKLVTAPIYSTDQMSEKQIFWNWGYTYEDPTTFSRSREYSQVAFTWDLPDPKISVMVLGTCYDNYQGWYPVKLILRDSASTESTDTSRVRDKKPEIIKLPTTGAVTY